MTVFSRSVLPVLLLGSLLTGCATHSDGDAPLNQRTWPICSLIGGLVGGGLGAIESGGWAGGGAALGILTGGLICYAQDGDEDGDGVFDADFDHINSASAAHSSAFGVANTASGDASNTFGYFNTASGESGNAFGSFNAAAFS